MIVSHDSKRDAPTFDPRIDDSWVKDAVFEVVKLQLDVGIKGVVVQ